MKRKAILTVAKYGAAVAAGAIGVLAIAAWSFLAHGIGARETPSGLESFVAPRLRSLAIPSAARSEKNPVAANPAVLKEAMEHFADHCAICHGNDGSGNAPIGKGLYPKPPDMRTAATQDLTDGELFYIIHNGVRLTGMPAFGRADDRDDRDEASWKLVYFIRHLPILTVEENEAMKDLNPKTPADLKEEEDLQRFLRGETDAPSDHAGHSGHH